jgi:uncharacterized membrane protein
LEGEEGLIDEEVTAVVVALVLVAGVMGASQLLASERVAEPFSEFGLLGPEMKIGGYPKTVLVNETLRLYLYLGNHEGRVMYYRVLAKLGDESTKVDEAKPAEAEILAEYEAILPHGQNTTIPISLSIKRPMNNARLIFEMWILDGEEFRYHGRWLQLWINVTAPRLP